MSSQVFQVLCCVECKIFQVHFVKKSSNKWNCKVCSTKQSVQQIFGKGTGAECRKLVQRLNSAKKDIEEERRAEIVEKINQEFDLEVEDSCDRLTTTCNSESSYQQLESADVVEGNPRTCVAIKESKWNKYLDDDGDTDSGNHLY